MPVIQRFVIRKEVFLCLRIDEGVEAYRIITPQMGYLLELDDDNKLWLAKPRENYRLQVKGSMDLARPGMFKLLQLVKGVENGKK